ncbi:hypothetical protein [Gluconacetobacter tumulisoli]|uniref:DUF945 domain-containing protein n=1 Tax=Gluconacetobacter tumulisoli TaxID=1286189 RepID=A0A7W4K8K8_9PROT|nr:hypothetical protein [Gluconacetobacter tumulisoli]
MKKLSSALMLLLIIVIVGGLGLRHFARQRLESAVADLRAAIGPDASLTYATATPRLLARGAAFTSITYRDPLLTVTAADAVIGRVTGNAVGGQRIGRVTLHGVQIMEPGATASIDLLVLDGLVLPNTSPPSAVQPAPPRLDSILLDAGRVEGLHIAVPGTQTDVTITRASVRQYGLGRSSHLDLDTLAAQINLTPGRHIAIGHLHVDGPDFAGQIASLLQSGHMIHETGRRHVDASAVAIDATGPLLRIGHLSVDHDATATRDELDGTIGDLTLWPAQDQSLLRMIGYDRFAGDIHAIATVDRQNGRLQFHPLVIDVPAMGRMGIMADLDQIPVDDPMSLPETARIVSATIDWRDRSLAGHVLDGLARARQVAPDVYRQQVSTDLAASPDGSMQALGRFLQSPDHPLQILLRPPQPLNVAMLGVALSMAGDPATAGLLGLTISSP